MVYIYGTLFAIAIAVGTHLFVQYMEWADDMETYRYRQSVAKQTK